MTFSALITGIVFAAFKAVALLGGCVALAAGVVLLLCAILFCGIGDRLTAAAAWMVAGASLLLLAFAVFV